MYEQSTTINLVFKHKNKDVEGQIKKSFWTPFLNTIDKNSADRIISADALENRIRNQFPHELKRYLLSLEGSNEIKKDSPFKGIVISVTDIKYGSLDIGLIFEPFEKLKNLFENNFDYFEVFLKSYSLLAFRDTLANSYGLNPLLDDAINNLDVDITYNRNLIANFQNISAQYSNQSSTSNRLQFRANWLWIVSNTSLLVPILIASAVLYFSYVRLQANEKNLTDNTQKLYQIQNQIIENLITEKTSNIKKDSIPK